eukprot:scaffold1992_cov250-Pinguiococcus_pyrenoidosus.AAC.2
MQRNAFSHLVYQIRMTPGIVAPMRASGPRASRPGRRPSLLPPLLDHMSARGAAQLLQRDRCRGEPRVLAWQHTSTKTWVWRRNNVVDDRREATGDIQRQTDANATE